MVFLPRKQSCKMTLCTTKNTHSLAKSFVCEISSKSLGILIPMNPWRKWEYKIHLPKTNKSHPKNVWLAGAEVAV